MPKFRYDEEIVRYHTRLFKSDLEWLRNHYGSEQQIGAVVRQLVKTFRQHRESIEREKLEALEPEPLDLFLPEITETIDKIKEESQNAG